MDHSRRSRRTRRPDPARENGKGPIPSSDKVPSSPVDEITHQLIRERPADDLDNVLLRIYLQKLGRLIELDFERYCKQRFELGAADMRLLLALRRAGPSGALRPTDLFRALYLSSGAITKQVDRLARKRLVARASDPAHAGGFLIRLTAAGRKIVDEVLTSLAKGAIVVPELSEMPKRDRAMVLAFCRAVIRAAETSQSRGRLRSRAGRRGDPAGKVRQMKAGALPN